MKANASSSDDNSFIEPADWENLTRRPSSQIVLWPVLSLCVLALILRTALVIAVPDILTHEGAEYARMAENLWAGHGLVGTIDTGSGPQLVHSPLYPALIAPLVPLFGGTEHAAKFVSIVMGTLMVIPIFLIAQELYGYGVGLMAGMLTAIHPYLVWLPSTAYSETTFMTMTLFAVFWGMQCFNRGRLRDALFSGIFFGLAYLSRPLALAYPAVTTFFILLTIWYNQRRFIQCLTQCLWLLIPFMLLAMPYVWFLYDATGHIRFEGKGPIVYTISERMETGMDYWEASYGISGDLEPVGPELDHTAFVIAAGKQDKTNGMTYYLLKYGSRNAGSVVKNILKFSTPIIPVLALWGLFGSPWDRRRIISELYLIAIVALMILPLLALLFTWSRYVAPLVPFLIIWAAKGAQEGYFWLRDTGAAVNWGWLRQGWLRQGWLQVTAFLLLITLILGSAVCLPPFSINPDRLIRKEAGLWLAAHDNEAKAVMDVLPLTPYYAKGSWLPLPYADSERALAYIAGKNPDYIVLADGDRDKRPYIEEWIEYGIPDERAQRIYRSGTKPHIVIEIYRWRSSNMPILNR